MRHIVTLLNWMPAHYAALPLPQAVAAVKMIPGAEVGVDEAGTARWSTAAQVPACTLHGCAVSEIACDSYAPQPGAWPQVLWCCFNNAQY